MIGVDSKRESEDSVPSARLDDDDEKNRVVMVFEAIIQPDDNNFNILSFPSQLGLQNTLTASLQRDKTPLTSVLDMTLNNLMVRFQ